MPAAIEKAVIDGIAGPIELAFDWPAEAARGVIYIGHPHPLFGGTFENKVVATVARTFSGLGWLAVRINFRGVGRSAGTHDEGVGETEDFLHMVASVTMLPEVQAQLQLKTGVELPIGVAGFSFGSYVAARATQALAAARRAPRFVVLVGAAAGKWPMPNVPVETLVIHGELDETIPLIDVFEWARPQDLPVVVVPGADHFFHRRLGLLKRLIRAHIQGMSAIDATAQTV